MKLNERQRIILETTTARDQAEALLRSLLDAKDVSERRLGELHQPDALKLVTGRSSIDRAIGSTQRMIESLNRAINDLKKDLSDEDVELMEGEGKGAEGGEGGEGIGH